MVAVEVVGLAEVGQVFMISEDLNWSGRAEEVMAPGIKYSHDNKQLPIIDVIIPFGRAKHLGKVGARVPVTIDVFL